LRAVAYYFRVLEWGKTNGPATLASELVAAIIVAFMPVPQSLAYAL